MIDFLWLLIILFGASRLASMFPAHRWLMWGGGAFVAVLQVTHWGLHLLWARREARRLAIIHQNMAVELEDLLRELDDTRPYPGYDQPYHSPTTGRLLNDSPE